MTSYPRTRLRLLIGTAAGTVLLAGTAPAGVTTAAAAPSTAVAPVAVSPATATADDPAADPALAAYYGQALAWQNCWSGQECATLTVPLSYDDPTLGSIGVRVLRVPAVRPEQRIGSLILNPGGPGGSGVEWASFAPFLFSEQILDRYDIVGFDPRGVARSTPAVECLSDRQTSRWLRADPTPDTARERREYEAVSRTMAEGCPRRTPGIAAHMDTNLVARDLDVLRAVLGDSSLHYLGFSYGTKIGSTYADLFPTRVGRMALDGAIDPTLNIVTLSKGQADGFQLAIRRFARDCPSHADCPLPARTSKALNRIQRFLDSVDANPIRASRGRPLVVAEAITGIIGSMYDDGSGWPALRQALAAAFRGNGRQLQQITDSFTNRRPNGTYRNNANVALYAVSCWDYPQPPGPAGLRRAADEWAADAGVPDVSASLAWGNLPCTYWPGRTSIPPHPVHAPGAPPILVVGTRYDPATPVQWSRALADQLDSGVYLEWRGDGHTAYSRGSFCVQEAVDSYLLSGIPPADGTVCR